MVIKGAQGIIQKKSASGSQKLPCIVIFFRNFILIWKCQKGSLNRGTLVSATAIYQTNCSFTVLSAIFLFFQMLPYDSKLFPGSKYFLFYKRWQIFLFYKSRCCKWCLEIKLFIKQTQYINFIERSSVT